MNTDRASRLAWSLTGAVLAMLAAAAVVAAINSDLIVNDVPPGILLVATCAVIGALAIIRQPRNLVGWLFLAVAVVSVLQDVCIELAILLYRHGGPRPVFQWLAWLSDRQWILIIGPLFVLLPLLFPDGRPPSRRWRGVGWLAVSLIFLQAVALAIAPGRLQTVPVQNPAGVNAIRSFAGPLSACLNAATIAVAFLCVSSLFLRYRRAGGDERQQAIKTRLADELVGKDDAEVHQMLAQIMTDLHDTLRDLRDLARGIYPPLLADAGLVSALRAQATKSALPVVIDADGVSRYPQEAETAVYFCALEALQNTAKYASATLVTIRLSDSDGALAISVADDGVGFDPATSHGTGIQG
jgi:hypothetical protein